MNAMRALVAALLILFAASDGVARAAFLGAARSPANVATAAAVFAPRITAVPTISGAAEEGATLTAAAGEWARQPTSFITIWQRARPGQPFEDVPGARTAEYVPRSADVGFRLRVRITAVNDGGTRTGMSDPTAPVAEAATGPLQATPDWIFSTSVNPLWAASSGRGTLYAGGAFAEVRTPTGNGALVAAPGTAAAPATVATRINGPVTAAIGDGRGGFYVGGRFNGVAGVRREGLAHLDEHGRLLPLDVAVRATGNAQLVLALARHGDTLYVGGQFSTVGGQARTNAAAIDLTNGAVTSFAPNPNSFVYALARSGSSVVLGGAFSRVGATNRPYLAAVDAASGVVSTTLPSPNAPVRALLSDATTTYVGGQFTTIGGVPRQRVAAIDGSGALLPFAPTLGTGTDAVRALALSGGDLFVGGSFAAAGVTPRNLARLDPRTGASLPWTLAPDGPVLSLAASGSDLLHVGGDFTALAGEAPTPRATAVRTVPSAGTATGLAPRPAGAVEAVAAGTGQAFIGGSFSGTAALPHAGIVEVDARTGALLHPELKSTGTVATGVVRGEHLYVGGTFTAISGVPRSTLARIDTATAEVDVAWATGLTGSPADLAVSGNRIVVSGQLASGQGASANRVVAVDAATGAPDPAFTPTVATGPVTRVVPAGDRIYVAGSFTAIGDEPRQGIAALDAVTGHVLAWNPTVNMTVFDLALSPDGSTIYIAGRDTASPRIVAVSASTGLPTSFATAFVAGSSVSRMAWTPEGLLASGTMTPLGASDQPNAVRLDAASGAHDPSFRWPVMTGSSIRALPEGLVVTGPGTSGGTLALHTRRRAMTS